jgi:spermidine synthase
VIPRLKLATAEAPDGTLLELYRRGHEFEIRAGGYQLMSNEDDSSSRSLAEIGCRGLGPARQGRVLVGGLGMGFTLRAALEHTGPGVAVEVAELVPAVVEWNREILGELAGHPLADPRARLYVGDVRDRIREARPPWDAILLDVDNGPDSLAHPANDALYSARGLAEAWGGLRPGGVLGVWSFSDDARFTLRLRSQGFAVEVHRVHGSRKGRGRYHYIWEARRPEPGRG